MTFNMSLEFETLDIIVTLTFILFSYNTAYIELVHLKWTKYVTKKHFKLNYS